VRHLLAMKERKARPLVLALLVIATAAIAGGSLSSTQATAAQPQSRPTLYWGTTGPAVSEAQSILARWGYYRGAIDGVYGAGTYSAVLSFQRKNGLPADGVVGPVTWRALGIWVAPASSSSYRPTTGISRNDQVNQLARLVWGEAQAEPYVGKVAVAAVVLNRVDHPSFPNSLSSVVYQPHAFESVTNGRVYRGADDDSYRAARDALNGWDPTYGAIYFWNPYKQVNPWVWTRQIITQIGNHVFAR